MAGNSERIDDVIDRAAVRQQINDTIGDLDVLELGLLNSLRAANQLNQALGRTQSFRQYTQAADQAAASTARVAAAQDRAAIVANRLQVSNARTAQQLQQVSQRVAATSTEYQRLVASYNAATAAARESGVVNGVTSQQYITAASRVRELRTQLDSIDQPLGNFQRNVGNYASAAFGAIRTLANILPNFGIGTFFLVLGTGIGKIFDIIRGGESTLSTTIKLNKQANDTYAEQATKVGLLVAEVQDGNTTQERQREILEKLNEVSPTYFGNLKDIQDVVTKLPEDYKKYNEALLINSRIQAGQALLIEKNKDLLEQQRLLFDLGPQTQKADTYLGKLAGKFKDLANVFSTTDLAKGFNAEGFSGLLNPSAKGLEGNIKNIQKSVVFLNNSILADSKRLQQAGGDIAGDALAISQRIANSEIEIQRIKTQAIADSQKEIVDDDKKSYSARQEALKNFAYNQKQVLGLQLDQDLNDITLTNDKKKVLFAKYSLDIQQLNIDTQKQEEALTRSASKDQIALYKARLERQKSQEEAILNDQTKSYRDRFNALDDYEKKSREVIKLSAREQIRDAGDNSLKVKAINEKQQDDLNKVKIDGEKKRQTIQKQINDEVDKIQKQQLDNLKGNLAQEISSFQDAQNQKLLEIDVARSKAASALAKQYADGKISALKYNQELYNVDQAAAEQRIKVQIDVAEAVVKAQAAAAALGFGNAKDLQKSTNDLTKLRIQASDLATNKELENIKKIEDARDRLAEKQIEIASAALTLIQTVVDSGYQSQLDALKEQSDQVDKNAQGEKDAIDRSLLSQEQKADRTRIIDAQVQARKEVIAEKERKIRSDQAKFDRAIAIARIIQETAIAVVQALKIPIVGIALAATIGALGAVQLATVLATPLPKFAKGTNNSPEGFAHVGEEGTELRINPDGKMSLTPDKDTVTFLQKGTKIIPHKQLMGLMKGEQIKYVGGQQLDMSEVVKAIKENKPTKQQQPRINGWDSELRNRERFGNYRNRHFS